MFSKSNLYKKSPVWVQNALVTLQGLKFEKQRVNKQHALQHYNFLLESQFWSKDQLIAYQNSMLTALLKESFSNVPYYAEMCRVLGCSYQDFKSLEDLSRLPVLKKGSVRGNEQLFINKKYRIQDLRQSSTSGSTGTPMKLFGIRDNFSKRWAFELRLRKWAELADVYHPRRAQFTGRDILPDKNRGNSYWRYNYAANALLLSTSDIRIETAKAYAEAMLTWKPEFIDGYPSSISVLARLCLENNIELPVVKAIRVSAETLFEEDRIIIEKAFKGTVFNQYGSSESSCFCSDNQDGQMLVHPEYGMFEVLQQGKDLSAEAGKEGRVITTSFMNPVMPLIRYELGDLVVKSNEQSGTSNGRHFEVLNRVSGRIDDILFIKGIGYLGRLDPIFKNIEGIVEAQIILESEEKLKIVLVPAPGYKESTTKLLEQNLRKKVGTEIGIEFEKKSHIPRGANGKFKAVIDLTKNKR